ncbi:MAG TPA: ABC transporter permease subunit [Pirellulales bacterium]|jgi:ABC-2 type transport system permease protein|nr:ABC transporter permease subunit [Pirellulales bacterium]
MNTALWKKSIYESRWLLISSAMFMFAVHWLRVWVSSFFSSSALEGMFSFMPDLVEELLPVPFAQVATSTGRIAVAYDDPIVLLLVTVWAISRGSDAVSGELNRGTMEMLLAQPVTRLGVLLIQAATTLTGAALLAGAALAGTSTGLAMIHLEEPAAASAFVPAALNLFAFTVFLAGLTTLVSSGSNYRSHTIGIVGAVYAISMILKIIGRLAPGWKWLTYTSFFTPFEPQLLVSNWSNAWSFRLPAQGDGIALGGLGYDGLLIGLGLLAYVGGAIIFARRDLPAPL